MSAARTARRRARSLFAPRPPVHRPRRLRRPPGAVTRAADTAPWHAASAVALGLGVAVAVGGPAGLLLGAAAAGWSWRRLRRRRAEAAQKAARARARAVAAHVPLVVELLAACLAAGSGPAQAAEAVGRSVGGPLGDGLVRAALELRLGDEPAAVWARFADRPGCAVPARCMERAGAGGVPAIRDLSRVARESRALRARAATESARRVAVLVTGPLGLCFLPAFLAVGVAPVVVGLAKSLL
jgi:Flp pilus assembly protein TadB